MKVIDMTYNPITGVQYDTVEIPDQEIITDNAEKAVVAYNKAQQIREKRTTRARKNNTKHK